MIIVKSTGPRAARYKFPRETMANTQLVLVIVFVGLSGTTLGLLSLSDSELQRLIELVSQGVASKQARSTVYVRWGRTECRTGAAEVYSGYMAGASTQETGGTSEHLCLPDTPQWARYVNGFQSHSHVWGTEYHNHFGYGPSSPFLLKYNSHGLSVHQHNVPCVLCHVTGPSVTWTFPAMTSCPAGWRMEYQGYLMSGYVGHAGRVKHECIDEAPEVIAGGGTYEAGSTLHFMETKCTPLDCPPYVEGRELACSVCSRS